ncbi:hypothetical protein J3A83DRAFT_4225444 [Scleroderma citrinum]
MLGARTKQVFSYGRRGHRIVNISERREKDQPIDEPCDANNRKRLQRENAIILSPTRPRVQRRRKRSSIQDDATTPLKIKPTRITKKHPLEADTPNRHPLTPVRFNGTSPGRILTKKAKLPRAKASPYTSLKSHSPIVTMDIILMDEEGRTVSQERRLSHPDVQTNVTHTSLQKNHLGSSRVTQPIIISEDSDTDVSQPRKPSRVRRKPNTCNVVSSDGSETESDTLRIRRRKPLADKTSGSFRMEVVIPPAPYRIAKEPTRPPRTDLSASEKTLSEVPTQRRIHPMPSPPIPHHLHVSKARPLTPIRRGPRGTIFQRTFPTPSTPTEVDLSLELAQLDIADVTESEVQCWSQPSYLLPLLDECSQTRPHEFSAFIETFPFDSIVQSVDVDEGVRFQKIGEASFSEVFGIGDVVLKVIPIHNDEDPTYQGMVEMPALSDAPDILKEIIVTREIGEMCKGFVRLLKTYVVRGKYPTLFLKLWDEYNKRKGSESVRPDSFGLNQVYAIIVLPNGGPDLESFTFKNSKCGWQQACSVFWQVARSLGEAEDLVHFEHRDLHLGQILVKNVPTRRSHIKTAKVPMDDPHSGVKITIIDLGLSRMDATDCRGRMAYWTPFDEDIFEGEGDYQYEIYRMMRVLNYGAWDEYQPFTNVMWLHYLASKLLRSKHLKPPGTRKKVVSEEKVESPTGYGEKECYECLVEMERLLGNCISMRLKVHRSRRKTVVLPTGPKSAQDVVAHGVQRGWMQ